MNTKLIAIEISITDPEFLSQTDQGQLIHQVEIALGNTIPILFGSNGRISFGGEEYEIRISNAREKSKQPDVEEKTSEKLFASVTRLAQ